jgi:hypothetical protein
VPDLQNALQMLGFHRFFETTDSVKHRVSGLKGDLDVMVIALRAPADGPIGDSALVVSDGVTTAFNMNDARPVDLDVLASQFGHIDVHMLRQPANGAKRATIGLPRSRKSAGPSRSIDRTAAACTRSGRARGGDGDRWFCGDPRRVPLHPGRRHRQRRVGVPDTG